MGFQNDGVLNPSFRRGKCFPPVALVSIAGFMAQEIIRTPNAPSPPPSYSQAVRAAGSCVRFGHGAVRPGHRKDCWRNDPGTDPTVPCECVCHPQSRGHFPRPRCQRHRHHPRGDGFCRNERRVWVKWFPDGSACAAGCEVAGSNSWHEGVDRCDCRGISLSSA